MGKLIIVHIFFIMVVLYPNATFAEKAKIKKSTTAKVSPSKKTVNPSPRVSKEYVLFEKIKKITDHSKLTLNQIVEIQGQLKGLSWIGNHQAFEKEIEDLYWYFEIARAQKIGGLPALNAWIRSLQSLNQFKWIYAWTEKTSAELVKICKKPIQNKTKSKSMNFQEKTRYEKCDYLAKRVNEAFPKGALETQPLKDILPEATAKDGSNEKYDRLSQSYSEKTEKDEVAFAEVLDLYLKHEDSSLEKKAKEFIDAFPKSMLRFRAMFLMAERLFANDDKKEAEPFYQQLISETPYSYYAIVSSERLGISLTDRILKDPIATPEKIDEFNLNLGEKEAFCKLENLVNSKKSESAVFELEEFSRVRNYPTSFLIHLIQQANQVEQDLSGFRLATEILQRKGEAPLKREFVDLIFPDRFTKEIEEQAKLSKIDPLLVVSLMKQESGFKKTILSSSGAVGLMQLMPFTAIEVQKDLHLRKLREPAKNIEVGTKYIASLLNDKFNGNVVYALAGYNAGPFRVVKWKKDAKPDWGMQEFIEAIPFKETRDYVMSILRNRYWYQYRRGLPVQSVFEAWRSP